MKTTLVLLATILLVGYTFALVPLLGEENEDKIVNEFIVLFEEKATHLHMKSHLKNVTTHPSWDNTVDKIKWEYDFPSFIGYSVRLHALATLNYIRSLPHIQYVEYNSKMYTYAPKPGCEEQEPTSTTTWGQRRLSVRTRQNEIYSYQYPQSAGEGTRSYIADTGINYDQEDIKGRTEFGFDAFGGKGLDGNGHGSHVAGTVGGTRFGVAKKTTLISIKVLSDAGSGSTDGIVAGLNWIIKNEKKPSKASVNLSLGGSANSALDKGLADVISAGITAIVAAGNSNQNACNFSPARVSTAITVGAIQELADLRSSYSNFGTCVDIFAPGDNVHSIWKGTATSENKISGTSMASPHVAGLVALYLGDNDNTTPAAVKSAILGGGSSINISNGGTGSPNLIAASSCLYGSVEPEPIARPLI